MIEPDERWFYVRRGILLICLIAVIVLGALLGGCSASASSGNYRPLDAEDNYTRFCYDGLAFLGRFGGGVTRVHEWDGMCAR